MVVLKNVKRGSRGKAKGKPVDRNRQEVARFAGDAYDLARRSWSGLNQIRKLINIEEKFLDTSVSQNPDQSGAMTCISQTAQGTTMNTRIGLVWIL